MSLLVTGSLGIDTVETPHGRVADVLGGSAVHFAFGAAIYGPVRMVGVVGEDFPSGMRDQLASADIDLAGLETRAGSKTFRWSGKYTEDMNDRDTLDVQLNVLAEDAPQVPDTFADSAVLFLANTHPALQRQMRAAVPGAKLTVCDTMDLWIESARDELVKTLGEVDGLIINDGEARQLTGCGNLIEAGEAILALGPRFTVIKKGEHGAMLLAGGKVTAIPAFPTKAVKDPTGAGDSFAGGMLGYLAAEGKYDDATMRRALLHGTVVASFTIEDFSVDRIRNVTRAQIDERVAEFATMLRCE
jgi:sugar/nucleoside kinase (ribokinase family)